MTEHDITVSPDDGIDPKLAHDRFAQLADLLPTIAAENREYYEAERQAIAQKPAQSAQVPSKATINAAEIYAKRAAAAGSRDEVVAAPKNSSAAIDADSIYARRRADIERK
jgi:hypothetical protein